MAKTNPYTSRQATTALAFDEEQTDDFARPAGPSARTRTQPSGSGVDADFSRVRRRTPTRQGGGAFLLHNRFGRILLGTLIVAAIVLLVLAWRAVRDFVDQDARFRVASADSIQIEGNTELTRPELLAVFGGDIGRNIFFVPLAKRQAQLEQVPWVEHATVMRLLPDQLRVSIVERVPIAFVRLGSTVELADADGVILHLPSSTLAARHYSFPVVTGFTAADPPAARAARMHLYQRFVTALDAGGQPLSPQLSEVDLSDLEDVRAVVPAQGSDILLQFGDSDFLARYRSYQAHLAEWRAQYPQLSSVDLRYDRQVVLKMADGSENEASSVDHGNSLAAAPQAVAVARPHHPAPAAHHPAGHGTAHGWRPQ